MSESEIIAEIRGLILRRDEARARADETEKTFHAACVQLAEARDALEMAWVKLQQLVEGTT